MQSNVKIWRFFFLFFLKSVDTQRPGIRVSIRKNMNVMFFTVDSLCRKYNNINISNVNYPQYKKKKKLS